MWYVCDILYVVLYVRVSCFVVRGCGVSRRYIDVCYCDMFSVVNVYLDHLKFCLVLQIENHNSFLPGFLLIGALYLLLITYFFTIILDSTFSNLSNTLWLLIFLATN